MHQEALAGRPARREAQRIPSNSDYAELRRRLTAAGVFRRQYIYYSCHAVLALAMVTLALGLLFVVEPFWLKLLDAAFLANAAALLGVGAVAVWAFAQLARAARAVRQPEGESSA